MRLIHSFVLVAISLPVASAQGQRTTGKSNDAPVRVQRKAPPANVVDRYDFGAQINALQGNPVSPVPLADQRSAPGAPPKTFQPKEDVELTATAREAVKVSEQWMAAENHPAARPDGRVLYSYGAGLPTIVCAPLRICIIELQVGEKVIGEPQIGNSVRWNLGPAQYSTGDTATSLVILKPHSAGLDTNLVITTDRARTTSGCCRNLRTTSRVSPLLTRMTTRRSGGYTSQNSEKQINLRTDFGTLQRER
jgi:hypothetical protein